MRTYAARLEASWKPGTFEHDGFFAVRVVMAEDEQRASEIATERLKAEIARKLPGAPEYSITTEEIWEVEASELLETPVGWILY